MIEYNVYGGGTLDRLVERRTDAAWFAQAIRHADTRFVLGWQHRLPVIDAPDGPRLVPVSAAAIAHLEPRAPVLLGAVDGVVHMAVDAGEVDEAEAMRALVPGARFADLRDVGSALPASEAAMAAAVRGLLLWHGSQRHCGRCGAPTAPGEAGHTLVCTNGDCGNTHHPRIEPAAITLVTDGGDRCLLGARKGGQPGIHACFAGFVEAGESLEAAAAREVREEAGIEVADVRYHSSQPWPFPSQLMVGFVARAATFDVHVDDVEIREARWFTREELLACPQDDTFRLPRADSVARRMIEDWMHGRV